MVAINNYDIFTGTVSPRGITHTCISLTGPCVTYSGGSALPQRSRPVNCHSHCCAQRYPQLEARETGPARHFHKLPTEAVVRKKTVDWECLAHIALQRCSQV